MRLFCLVVLLLSPAALAIPSSFRSFHRKSGFDPLAGLSAGGRFQLPSLKEGPLALHGRTIFATGSYTASHRVPAQADDR